MREINFVLDDLLGGDGFKDFWNFHPEKFGEDEPILTHIISDALVNQPPTGLGMLGVFNITIAAPGSAAL